MKFTPHQKFPLAKNSTKKNVLLVKEEKTNTQELVGGGFIVKAAEEKLRLDKFLTEKLAGQTRSQIKKMIKNQLVDIDGVPAKVHQFLKSGQKIEIKKPLAPQTVASKSEVPLIKLEPTIIFENQDYVVLDKPVGVLVHQTEKQEAHTLASWLMKKYPELKNIGGDAYRAGIIHRLDRDVSGVMVAAKTQAAFDHLKNQFQARTVGKDYIAVVYGHVTQPSGSIDLPIGRNKEGLFVAHPRNGQEKFSETDKLAKTKYTVLEYLKDYTVLRVTILTGRTHQIRAHLFAIGHPILGDQLYKPKKTRFTLLRRKIKLIDPGRIFLHSEKISFTDLTNVQQEYHAKLPQSLTNFLDEHRTK